MVTCIALFAVILSPHWQKRVEQSFNYANTLFLNVVHCKNYDMDLQYIHLEYFYSRSYTV